MPTMSEELVVGFFVARCLGISTRGKQYLKSTPDSSTEANAADKLYFDPY